MKNRIGAALVLFMVSGTALAQHEPAPVKADAPAPKAAAQPEGKPDAKSDGKSQSKGITLTVGDKAPELAPDKWVKGSEVKSFESGKVYVVEFWATWCMPCRKSIPHLTQIQKDFKSDVTVIGVSSNEPWEDVDPFVTKQGDAMGYTVAWDQKGKVGKAWMTAAGARGIPHAFIVDKTGRIAWQGHPMDGMDDVLSQVVKGTYDVNKAAAKAKKAAENQEKIRPLVKKAREAFDADDKEGAIKAIDEIIAVDPETTSNWAVQKFGVLLVEMKAYDRAYAWANQVLAGQLKDKAEELNAISWTILDTEGVEQRDLATALKVAERANTLTKGAEPQIMDTYARALFETGNVDKAIEVQTKAVELTTDSEMKKELQGRLEDYTKKAKKG